LWLLLLCLLRQQHLSAGRLGIRPGCRGSEDRHAEQDKQQRQQTHQGLPFFPAKDRRIAGLRQVFSNAAMMRSRVKGMS
jgi:hypothetical protein